MKEGSEKREEGGGRREEKGGIMEGGREGWREEGRKIGMEEDDEEQEQEEREEEKKHNELLLIGFVLQNPSSETSSQNKLNFEGKGVVTDSYVCAGTQQDKNQSFPRAFGVAE